MEIIRSIRDFLKRKPMVVEPTEPTVKSLGERLAENNQPFPYGLLSQDEKVAIDRQIRGTASVTSGGVILSPWQCLSEERVQELVDQAKGIGRASSGLSELDPRLWNP